MRTQKNHNFFWPSYADLMTSLFFVMLVLYVLTVGRLWLQQQELEKQKKATEEQLAKIREIQRAVKELPKQFFRYDDKNKRFTLIVNPHFKKYSFTIEPQYFGYLDSAGREISALVGRLKRQKLKYLKESFDIKYILIIEGMASNDIYQDNYRLSYQRALSLYDFWNERGIYFDPNICEIQIAGSGTGGIGRDETIEANNQRFLIQIIPKIGEIR